MTIKLQYLDKIIRTYISHMNILPHDDALLGLLKDMERNYENTLSGNTGIISIQLDPTVYRVPLEDDRIALMYSETKRGLSYLMQVEDVDTTIADLLTSAVFPEDDIQFKQLISDYPSIGEDLARHHLRDVEYIKFKKHVIQRVKELTQLGVIGNVNKYQSILNDIAHSIRSRPYLGSFSERELMFMTDVQDHLKKKETYLSLLLEALKTATAKAIKVTQKSQNYEPVKKTGWGKMIKEAYKKAHGYDSNFPDGVHHKWSTRVLCDRGVLQKFNGEAVNSVELNFFGSSSSKCPEVEFRISTQNGEVFNIYLIDSKKRGNYEHATLKLKDLLEKEAAEDQATVSILKGNHTTFAVSPLLDLLCETFFS